LKRDVTVAVTTVVSKLLLLIRILGVLKSLFCCAYETKLKLNNTNANRQARKLGSNDVGFVKAFAVIVFISLFPIKK